MKLLPKNLVVSMFVNVFDLKCSKSHREFENVRQLTHFNVIGFCIS